MLIKELIEKLSYYGSDRTVMIQDSNGFIHDIDFICTEHSDELDTILLVAGQLQGCDYDGTRID